jgi:hypothetical protein
MCSVIDGWDVIEMGGKGKMRIGGERYVEQELVPSYSEGA